MVEAKTNRAPDPFEPVNQVKRRIDVDAPRKGRVSLGRAAQHGGQVNDNIGPDPSTGSRTSGSPKSP